MNLIDCKFCGINTRHPEDYRYERTEKSGEFLLMFFRSPFIYTSGKRALKSTGHCYILFPPFSPAGHGSYGVPMANDWIYFSGDWAEDIVRKFSLPYETPFYLGDNSIISPYISKIESELSSHMPGAEDEISSTIASMLINLGRQYTLRKADTHSAFDSISLARSYMLGHLDSKITLEHLAGISGYSVNRFCVLYNKFFSSSPIDDLLCARIEKAESLLKYNRLSVSVVAKKCGFSSVSYFSRKFKEKNGVSPRQFVEYK